MARLRLDDYLKDSLKDPKLAAAYLQAALEDGGLDTLLMALQTLAKHKGGLSVLAHKTGLHRVHLYRMLGKGGNPSFKNMLAIIEALGVQVFLQAVKKPGVKPASRKALAGV
jgi:probable addiction module antidote protein